MDTYTKERLLALVRLLAMAVGFANSCLIMKGMHPIPFDETAVTEWLAHGIDALLIIWGWWKDNNMRKATIDKKKNMIAFRKL